MPSGVYLRTKKQLKTPGSFQVGHPFYGDLSAPHFWKKGQVAPNKGIPCSEKQKQDISLSRDTPERRAEIEVVRHLYWDEELTFEEVSEQLGLTYSRMLYLMRRYVHWRSSSDAWKLWRRKHPENYEPYSFEFNWELKKRVKERDGYCCQLCGIPEAELSRELHTHHIEYNKQKNRLEDLISLCNSCHSKTNGNRSYWKNYFKELLCLKKEAKVLTLH